jgi:hypothetical protein
MAEISDDRRGDTSAVNAFGKQKAQAFRNASTIMIQAYQTMRD